MSEGKAILWFLASLALVVVLLIGAFVLSAYLVDIFIGLLAIVFLTLLAIGWRKWQHSRLPVNEDRREHRRLVLEEAERREQLRIERERHEHELQLARERHERELDLEFRTFQLQQHLTLTRAGYDANGNPPIFLHADRNLSLRIGPSGNRLDHVHEQLALGLSDRGDCPIDGVHRSVPGPCLADGFPLDFQLDGGRRHLIRSTLYAKGLQRDAVGHFGQFFRHDHFKILLIDLFLVIGEFLEAIERVIDFLVGQLVAQFLEALAEGMTSG